MLAKKKAAERAVELVEDGMIVGLGTGSTSYYAIQRIAQRVQEGLRIHAVASSKSTEEMAEQLGIPLIPFAQVESIDIAIDGADEFDKQFNLIKGGGGALLREKILAANSKKFVVIADESKAVPHIGSFPLPVEIVTFASEWTIRALERLGAKPTLRESEDGVFQTDNGNWIVDCRFDSRIYPEQLGPQLSAIPGVVEHGLFVGMTDTIVVGHADGTTSLLLKGVFDEPDV